jgi:hypothetical protein
VTPTIGADAEASHGPLRVLAAICLLVCSCASSLAQNQPAPRPGRPLSLRQTDYRLRPGERTSIDAELETLDFLRTAKTRAVNVNGSPGKGFAVAPDLDGEIVLAASLTLRAGEYPITLSAVDDAGQERSATTKVTVEALATVPTSSTTPPVVLLNGWQIPSVFPPSSCPIAPTGSLALRRSPKLTQPYSPKVTQAF